MNRTIPSDINNWDIDFDTYGYAVDDNWPASVLAVEDVLQLSHVYSDLIIDVGYYSSSFVILVIKSGNWDDPVERIEIGDVANLNDEVNRLVVKYVN